MTKLPDIHKAGGVLIRDRKVLVERSKNKQFFIPPGGSIEIGETSKQALVRELKEELRIDVNVVDLEAFDTFNAQAAGSEDKTLRMDVFVVSKWEGEPQPDSEVEEIRWIDSKIPNDIRVGSIFEHEVIPRLKQQGLID